MATKKKAAKKKKHFKSADTGRFVSADDAANNPKQTYAVGKKKKK